MISDVDIKDWEHIPVEALTDKEIEDLVDAVDNSPTVPFYQAFARAVEASVWVKMGLIK